MSREQLTAHFLKSHLQTVRSQMQSAVDQFERTLRTQDESSIAASFPAEEWESLKSGYTDLRNFFKQ